MILPDLNLLVYAYNSNASNHEAAKRWWEKCLSDSSSVGIPWIVILGFLRLMTGRQVMQEPFELLEAVSRTRSWLERPNVQVLQPGFRHLDLLESLGQESGATGKLTTDLHLAVLAIEHQAELHSNDSDFGRFPGLRWKNPLQ